MLKNVSQYSIKENNGYLLGILAESDLSNYPLNWTSYGNLPMPSEVDTEEDDTFGGLNITYEYMTYIVPSGADSIDDTPLQQLRALNPFWIQVNKVRIGYNSDVDYTRTFIMMEDTDATDTPKQILATIPGQYFDSDITSDDFTGFSWYQDAIAVRLFKSLF